MRRLNGAQSQRRATATTCGALFCQYDRVHIFSANHKNKNGSIRIRDIIRISHINKSPSQCFTDRGRVDLFELQTEKREVTMAMARKTLALAALYFMAHADAAVINTSVSDCVCG